MEIIKYMEYFNKTRRKKIFFWLDPTDKQQIQETKEYCATYTSEYVQTGRLPIFLPLIPYNILKDEITNCTKWNNII
eukprot:UN00513